MASPIVRPHWPRETPCLARKSGQMPVVGPTCIAHWYAECMPQLVTRVDEDLAAAVDALVAAGAVGNRSEAVRLALEQFVDRHRRQAIGARIAAGYAEIPQTDAQVGWADEASVQMIEDEPW